MADMLSREVPARKAPAPALHPSANPRDDASKAKIIAALAACAPALLHLGDCLQLAHWNVKGPSFEPLHKLFGEVYDVVHGAADRLIERATIGLGGRILATPAAIAAADLTPFPEDAIDGESLCRALTLMGREVSAQLGEARQQLDDLRAVDTSNLLQEIVLLVEHHVGRISAHLPPGDL